MCDLPDFDGSREQMAFFLRGDPGVWKGMRFLRGWAGRVLIVFFKSTEKKGDPCPRTASHILESVRIELA